MRNQSSNQSKNGIREILKTTLLFLILSLSIACGKQDVKEPGASAVSGKDASGKVSGAQPLPGGRANFTAAIGRFQTSTAQACWVRMVNYTFTASTGTVTATLHAWSSVNQFGKTAFTSHTCSVDSSVPSRTCSQYSPTGWLVGTSANPSSNWSGTYTYNSTTGALHIVWPNVGSGAWEDWTVSTVSGQALSRMVFVGSSSNYGITNGYAYGSNASWSTYKTVNQIPRVDFTSGNLKGCNWNGTDAQYTVIGSPQTQPFSLMGGVTGGNAIHMKVPQSPTACSGGCYSPSTGKTGIIHHLTSNNNSRAMVYNHHCACLPTLGEYPCYSGTIHPYAMMQIIDDNGAIKGLVGIHQQDQPGSAGFGYSINQWLWF